MLIPTPPRMLRGFPNRTQRLLPGAGVAAPAAPRRHEQPRFPAFPAPSLQALCSGFEGEAASGALDDPLKMEESQPLIHLECGFAFRERLGLPSE